MLETQHVRKSRDTATADGLAPLDLQGYRRVFRGVSAKR